MGKLIHPRFFLMVLILSAILYSCSDDAIIDINIDPTNNEVVAKENQLLAQIIPSNTVTTYVRGRVVDENHQPIADVEIKNGNISVTTDEDGFFYLGEITINASYAMVKATKTGYLEGFRTFTPTPNAINTISFQLLTKGNSVSFNAKNGGTITVDSDIQLKFPPNVLLNGNGEFYTGEVNVYGRYINPTDEDLGSIMPGMLAGLTEDGVINGMLSYGMLTVELEDNNGNILAIDGSQLVEVSLPAITNAPATIPLWHFNEIYGLWIEAGKANLVNNKYVAKVNHFSTWNLDIKFDAIEVDVSVEDNSGNPIANVDVNVLSNEGNILAQVYTNNNGKFTLINAPQVLTFEVDLPCEIISFNAINTNSGNVTLTVIPTSIDSRQYTIIGTLTDCDVDGNTIIYDNRYFTMRTLTPNDALYFGGLTDANGNFELSTILCDVSETTDYTINVVVIVVSDGNLSLKDTIITINFSDNSQILDINYCGSSIDTINDDFVIIFEDANLEEVVRQSINLFNVPITYNDVRYLEEMTAYNKNISSLEGIQYITNLTNLSLNNNQITDITALIGLTNLTMLSLSDNQITDITALNGLRNLNFISIQKNQIADITALSALTNLNFISLENNQIVDITALSGLMNLNTLRLTSNQIVEITPLNDLTNLTDLYFAGNQITDITALSGLINLSSLSLSTNQITDITALSGLTNLYDLYLFENQITNIAALSELTNLAILELSNNTIIDVTSLSGLTNLLNLHLIENQIVNVSPLSTLSNLNYLDLQFNQITNVASLCNLGNGFDGRIPLYNNPLTSIDVDVLRACLPNADIGF